MGLCVFNAAQLRRCVEHALAAKRFRMPFAEHEPPRPALLFVHDQGVYLMSNGVPADFIAGKVPTAYAVYAHGCNPNTDDDWWEYGRTLVGGDDFGEILPVNSNWLASCDEYKEFHINVSPTEIETYFVGPLPKKKKYSAEPV